MTSRSGFGDLLLPYDDTPTISRKLRGLKFRLDPRTGAIVADDDGTGPVKLGPDDAMMTLLGQNHRRLSASGSTSVATSWDPIKSPGETDIFDPYDPYDPYDSTIHSHE